MSGLIARVARAGSVAVVLLVTRGALAQAPSKAAPSLAVGDVNITPVVDLRIRSELRVDPPDLGGADPAFGPTSLSVRVRDAFAIAERARLGAQVDGGPVRARIVLEDARIWGMNPALGPSASTGAVFGPYEAWLEAHSSGGRPSWVRAGRQPIVWGEGLLLGGADFGPVGRALDAVRGSWSITSVLELEALAAMLAAPTPAGPNLGPNAGPWTSGTQLYGLRGAWAVDPLLKIEAAGLARIARGGATAVDDFAIARSVGETYTASLRASGDSAGLSYGAEGAAQFGRAENLVASTMRRAWAAAAHVGKTFETTWLTPSVRIGATYASGDEHDGGLYTAFDPILPDTYAQLGLMNAFAWSNTMQGWLRGGIAPLEDAKLTVTYRYLRLAQAEGEWLNGDLRAVGQGQSGDDAELGQEVDLVFSYLPWTLLELRAGYSGVLWGDGARTMLGRAGRGERDAVFPTFNPAATSHFGFAEARFKIP